MTPEIYKEFEEMVMFSVEFGEAFGKAFADKKFGWDDIGHFVTPLTKAPAAISDITKLKDMKEGLTPEQKAGLELKIKEEFDIPQDELEQKIEDGIALAIALGSYIASFFKKKEEVPA